MSDYIPAYIFGWDEYGMLLVASKCPTCGRFIKEGDVMINKLGDVILLEGWICSKCGEIKPNWWWDE